MKRRISETSSRLFVVIVMALGSILVMGGLWAAGGDLFWEDQSDKGHGPLLVPFAEASEKPGRDQGGAGQVDVSKLGVVQDGAPQVGTGQVGARQVGAS